MANQLNAAQDEAAGALDGAVLVLAGAGTGKTTCLVHRTQRLIEAGADPARLLAITFTRKAGLELRTRLKAAVGAEASRMEAGTFHAIGRKLLRADWERAGVPEKFEIVDEAGQAAVIAEVIDGQGDAAVECRDAKGRVAGEAVAAVRDAISRAKDLLLSSDDPGAGGQLADDYGDRGADITYLSAALAAYPAYEAALADRGALDFADLLFRPVRAMRRDESLRRSWAGKWDYVTVDEYQDTNEAQAAFLELLARDHGNICCVGDDDQAIYGFRGADHRFILNFEAAWPGARVIRLEENYRSTPLILAAANAVIAGNAERKGKTLRPGMDSRPCHKIRSLSAPDDWSEALWIAREIRRRAMGGIDRPDGCFVLYRANWQSRLLEEAMITEDVPYHLVGDSGFYARAEIADALAYVALAADPADAVALTRIHARPARGVGDKAVLALAAAVEEKRAGSLFDAAAALHGAGEVTATAARGMAALAAACETFMSDGPFGARLETLLKDVGYLSYLEEGSDPKGPERLRNLEELCRAAERLDGPQALLDRARRIHESRAEDAVVTLMTVHGAKGLEADLVIIAGFQEKVFPSNHAVTWGGRALEEERRLAYVALTRPRKRLFLTRHGPQSRFASGEDGGIPDAFLSRARICGAEEIPSPPSARAISYARLLASKHDLPLPDETAHDAERCGSFIDDVVLWRPPADGQAA